MSIEQPERDGYGIHNAVHKVRRAFKIAERAQRDDHDRFARLYAAYRAQSHEGVYRISTRSQYIVPVIFKTVETVLPRIVSVLFSTSPPIKAKWRINPGVNQDKIRNVDAMFEKAFDDKRLYLTVVGWLKQALIFGDSYLKIGWRQIKRTSKRFSLLRDNTSELQDEVVEDKVDVQNVNRLDIFFSPEATWPDPIGSAKYIIHKSQKRRSYIMAQKKGGLYGPKGGGEDFEEADLRPKVGDDTGKQKLQNALDRSSSTVGVDDDKDDPLIILKEYWENERVITTANDKILLRDEANPFGLENHPKKKPFVGISDTMIAGELAQIGEAEPLEHNQIELSTLRRQRTDNNNLIINRMWIYNKEADVDLEALKLSRPGGGVGARPIDGSLDNALRPLPQVDINGGSYREQESLAADAQDISGLLDYAVGTPPARRETATTVQLLQAAANLRFDIKIRNFNYGFTELATMIFERWSQFLTRPVNLRIPIKGQLGVEYKKITKDDFPNFDDVDLSAPGSPQHLMKDARQQKILQFVQMIMTNPNANPQAGLLLLIQALKEAEIDGIESIIQLLESPVPPPGVPGGNGGSPKPPVRPEGVPRGVNESPVTIPQPGPNR